MTAEERRRTRRALAVMAGTILLLGAAALVIWRGPLRIGPHTHQPAPHGGIVVPLAAGERHAHAEAVFGPSGAITVYLLGDDESSALPVEARMLEAAARAEGREATIVLLPVHEAGDAEAMTSRFIGRIPPALRGKPIKVAVPGLARGESPAPEFDAPAGPLGNEDFGEEERLYRTPRGKYNEGDIQINGGEAPTQSRRAHGVAHDFRPPAGDRICPLTGAKANPECTWTIGGQQYMFCCAPCIDEFVRVARDRPQEVKDPADYVKR